MDDETMEEMVDAAAGQVVTMGREFSETKLIDFLEDVVARLEAHIESLRDTEDDPGV